MADIIGYPVVGEKVALGSNVVDYNIREEQSISDYSVLTGASSVSNGQATIVYGVNAPKIIADTSIVGGNIGDVKSAQGKAYQYWTFSAGPYETVTNTITQFDLSEISGDLEIKQTPNGLEIPGSGTYYLSIVYGPLRNSSASIETSILRNGTEAHKFTATYTGTRDEEKETLFMPLSQGDMLSVSSVMIWHSGTDIMNLPYYMTIGFNKIT